MTLQDTVLKNFIPVTAVGTFDGGFFVVLLTVVKLASTSMHDYMEKKNGRTKFKLEDGEQYNYKQTKNQKL